MAKKMKWKRKEAGCYTSGDFEATLGSNGKWLLTHGGEEIGPEFQTLKGAQLEAERFNAFYARGSKKTKRNKAPFIMFDVKGEYTCDSSGTVLEGLLAACGGTFQFLAVRVDGDSNGARLANHAFLSSYQRISAGVGAKSGDKLSTVKLIGHEGEWVMALLPMRAG